MIKEMILEKGCMHKRHLGSGSSPDQYTSTKGLVSLQKRKEARDNESEKAIILRDSKSKAVKLMEPTNKYMAQLLCLMIMPYKFEVTSFLSFFFLFTMNLKLLVVLGFIWVIFLLVGLNFSIFVRNLKKKMIYCLFYKN